MKTSKVAGLIITGMLAVAPAALAGGFGDIGLPSGRSSNGDQVHPGTKRKTFRR